MYAIIIFLSIFISNQPCSALEFVTKEAGIAPFLAQNQKWEKADLVTLKLALSPDKSREFISYKSAAECRPGLCDQVLFEKKNSTWRYLGIINGNIFISQSIHHDLFDIKAQTTVGSRPEDKVEEPYKYDGKRYVPTL